MGEKRSREGGWGAGDVVVVCDLCFPARELSRTPPSATVTSDVGHSMMQSTIYIK